MAERPTAKGVCERALAKASRPEQPRVSAFESDVRAAQRLRRSYGFRSDRAYVTRLARDPAARARTTDFTHGIPLSRLERRYFDDRFVVESEVSALAQYLATVPGLSGGLSIEDDGRRHAFALIRITRPMSDTEAHEVASRVRRFTLRRVRHSEAMLQSVADKITASIDGSNSRVDLHKLGVDIDRNAVVLEYFSPSARDGDTLKRRFGPVLVARRLPSAIPFCVPVERYDISSDGRKLTLRWRSKPDFLVGDPVAEVREDGDRVVAGAVDYLDARADLDAAEGGRLVTREVTMTLTQPLDGRRVVAFRSGQAVRRAR